MFFDNVQHYLLLAKVARRIQDDEVMHLLKMILKATGKKGVPQGRVIAPLLSNLYLAGAGNGFTVRLVRHSQRKRGATDRLELRNTAPGLDPTFWVVSEVFWVISEVGRRAARLSIGIIGRRLEQSRTDSPGNKNTISSRLPIV